jgi:hypothetical protein
MMPIGLYILSSLLFTGHHMVRRLFAAAMFLILVGSTATASADESDASSNAPSADAGQTAQSDGDASDQAHTKKEDIRRLLKITGTPELGLRIAERIVKNIKRSHPDVPNKFWAEFEEEMTKEEFIGIIVPLYDEHFTHDDIRKLIEFYKTDVGQKYVEKLPELSTKSMQAGRRWGQKLGQRIVDKLQAKGYE